jgi:tetratricopeptide (TPR) repeat protein
MVRAATLLAVCFALCAVAPTPADACYWDKDTLRMEKRRFPGVTEVITGKFLRHSKAFYKWRIKDREAKLAAGSSAPALHDDLAVAYAKVGELDKAIALTTKLLTAHPKRYEAHANLGTFYMMKGKLAEAHRHIAKAIEINPKAHFGREVVQLRLIEYLQERAKAKLGLPLDPGGKPQMLVSVDIPRYKNKMAGFFVYRKPRGFHAFVLKHKLTAKAARKGIMGMMRFANHRSPVLLEALGDLLMADWNSMKDGKRLAASAYFAASTLVKNDRSIRRYKAKAILTLDGQRAETLVKVERRYKVDLKRAHTWWARIEKNEGKWIAQGKDPEKMFRRVYYRKRR